MNNDLIDLHILSLLRLPAEQRTHKQVALVLADIAQAAQLETTVQFNPLSEHALLQQEQLKLAAIAELLRQELNFEHCSAQLDLRENANEWGNPLTVMLTTIGGDLFMFGSGRSAEEALRDLHPVLKSGKAA